jgi:hypothetical protein
MPEESNKTRDRIPSLHSRCAGHADQEAR